MMSMNSRISMQERLAAAMARKAAAGGRSGSPAPTENGSRTASPAPSIRRKDPGVNGRASIDSTSAPTANSKADEKLESVEPSAADIPLPDSRLSTDSPRQSLESSAANPPQPLENGHENGAEREDLLSTISLLESRLASESHASSERIDALEEKIRYLARTSAEASRRKASSTPSGGLEKKLAEAQEKIALLLEEGEKLSKNELKLQNTIKKLRIKTQEEEKATAEAKRGREKAEREAAEAKEKLRRAVEGKRDKERLKALGKVEGEVDGLRREMEGAQREVSELKEQLAEAGRRAEEAEVKVQSEALEMERRTRKELEEIVERVKNEAVLVEEGLRSEVRDLKSKIEKDAERARAMEQELKGEQMVGWVDSWGFERVADGNARLWKAKWSLYGPAQKKSQVVHLETHMRSC